MILLSSLFQYKNIKYNKYNKIIKCYLNNTKDWDINQIIPSSLTILSKWVNNYIIIQNTEIRLKLFEDSFLNLNNKQQYELQSNNNHINIQNQNQKLLKQKSQLLLNALSLTDDGIKFGMIIRSDVLLLLHNKKNHEELLFYDSLLSKWLFAVFCTSALKFQRVTFDNSSGLLLEKIAAEEAVHRIRALSEMKNRLTNGRRCFGLFHPWYYLFLFFI